ncbi:MAG TPA: LysE family translocator [Gaiellaceae bacterium]|nr:LysE family translocator [Gaiellaceae bacterium]
MLASLAAFLAVSVVVICTPGQDTALTVRNTLGAGHRGGIATACGVAAGQAVWTLAASAGAVALLTASEPAFRALKLVGAGYLAYLGLHSLLHALRGLPPVTARAAAATPAARAFRQGVLSNLANPKMAIFFASLLPQFAPSGPGSFAAMLALGLLFCSLTLAWLTLYAVAVHRLRELLAGPVRRVVDAVTGALLVLFGIRLAAAER